MCEAVGIHSDKKDLEGFVKICKFNELRDSEGRRFIVDDTEIAVFNINKEIFALSNICPHQHTALIYDGFLEDGCVVCPAHGWMFDLRTGKTPSGGRGLDVYEVKIFDEEVYVKVEKKKYNW